MVDIVKIGDSTLYYGDCLDVLPGLQKADVVITDPPYGVGRDKGFGGCGGFGGRGQPIARKQYVGEWDGARPSGVHIKATLEAGDLAVIFGGNYFADLLPVGTHWLVWDKLNTMPTFGDCELAWTNSPRKSIKKITVEYNGLIGKEKYREHATQKPLRLMEEIVLGYTKPAQHVIDPFMGSGTTGVACARHGRSFTGIEIDKHYFQIACERIEQAYNQPGLFEAEDVAEAIEQEAFPIG